MPRNVGTVLHNNFSRGLVTEATGLNFPDNAVTDADNVVFHKMGKVTRRLGYDIEHYALALDVIDPGHRGILREYVWRAVAKNGEFTFLVMHYGSFILIYHMKTGAQESLSGGVFKKLINLEGMNTGGEKIGETACSFASGDGYLFVAHRSIQPFLIEYLPDEDDFNIAGLHIAVRDHWGVEDALGVDEEPKDLSPEHAYNLANQGWYKAVRCGRVNNEPGGGSGGNVGPSFDMFWENLSDLFDYFKEQGGSG